MCNLISHYLILSPGRCSVQSCCLHPRHRFSDEKRCVAAQISTDFPLYVSRHTLFPHFPCVACRVNSLSLRTISTYLLKLFRCQSFVLSIIVQNIQLPKYTWFDSTNRWNQFIYLNDVPVYTFVQRNHAPHSKPMSTWMYIISHKET